MFFKKIALASTLAVLASTASYACEISARVSIIGNEFPAIQTVGAGAAAFALFLLFQLVTLPVEFNASNRAKRLVVEAGIVGPLEREGIDKVLNAAAMTYVAAFVTSLLTLLYFLHRAGFLGGRR